jgi:hypothetical protein
VNYLTCGRNIVQQKARFWKGQSNYGDAMFGSSTPGLRTSAKLGRYCDRRICAGEVIEQGSRGYVGPAPGVFSIQTVAPQCRPCACLLSGRKFNPRRCFGCAYEFRAFLGLLQRRSKKLKSWARSSWMLGAFLGVNGAENELVCTEPGSCVIDFSFGRSFGEG